MLEVLEGYFGDTICSSNLSEEDMEAVSQHIDKVLSDNDLMVISRLFTKVDVLGSLKDMGTTKAPSPNRLHVNFYQKC